MTDLRKIVFSCPTFDQFSKSLSRIREALPPEARGRLLDIVTCNIAKYGFQGTYERMKDRTIAQIFAEYQPKDVKTIESGEIAGMRYRLYDAPSPNTTDDENAADK